MPVKVLMVCLGNICRSPLAEGILKNKTTPGNCIVDSAGTSGFHQGALPDPRSIAIADSHQIDLRNQRSRKFSSEDFKNFDYIFVMDKNNYKNVVALASSEIEANKVSLIRNWSQPNSNLEVPDPYYDDDGFELVYQMLDKACDAIVDEILAN